MADRAAKNRSIGELITSLRDEFPELSVSKVRFLESQGLIDPVRSSSGYRMFTDDDVRRIQYILREQRDHFLPLKVIKAKLNSWERDERAPVLPASGSIPLPEVYFAGVEDTMSLEDFARTSGLTRREIEDLVAEGVFEPERDARDRMLFAHSDLEVATAAFRLLRQGLETRHLRTMRLAADRETDLIRQLATPLLRHRNPDARHRAATILADCSQAAVQLQEGIVRRRLKELLER